MMISTVNAHYGSPCKHCQYRKVCKARGLCSICYSCLEIRDKYPLLTTKNSKYDHNDFYGKAPISESPTGAIAGSVDKIETMRARAERKESLFHPRDYVIPVT